MGTNQVLDAVKQIGPTLEGRSAEIEQARGLPPDVVELIKPTGAFRMYVPADLDGPGVTAWESLEVIEELAYHDGAAGWCSMIGSTTSLTASMLPDRFANEIFGDVGAIAGGFAMPAGHATPVDGGLRVSGRWQWGSGTRHCTWIAGGCLVVGEDGTPQARADGLMAPFVFFQPDDVEFIDNWDVSGLSGTGSGDYQVTDVFVPEGRWVELGLDSTVRHNSLSRFSFFGLLACGVASCSMGIARRAVAELVELAGTKKPQGSSKALGRRPQVQADVAIAEAKLGSAWAFIEASISDSWASAESGSTPTVEQKRRLRLSATHATQTAAEVAELMYKAAGGAAVYKSCPLQRTFRDAFVATQHAMVAPRTFEIYGRLRLGIETDTGLL
jgi:alkylation response protein AidB-like acyl-CoA dehydrogenase